VVHRRRTLRALLRPHGALGLMDEQESRAFWRKVRDVAPFAADGPAGQRPVWRISTAPSKGAELGAAIAAQGSDVLYDWGGGLLWAALAPSDDAGAAVLRRAVASCGGHATLIRAPAAVRAAVDVFEPQDPGVAALTKRVKESFDPNGVLNPGRMWAGV
jgi:glycolate oxidase FAD binding subunit